MCYTEGLPSAVGCSPSGAALFSLSAVGAASGAASPASPVGAATSSAGAASVVV